MNVLSVLGKTSAEKATEDNAKSSVRADILRHVALGGGWSVGAAIVYGAFEVLHSDPHDAFPLLISWGPRAIGGIILIYVIYDLAKTMLNQLTQLVDGVQRMAAAQQQSADKDDRNLQEMQTLTAYTAQQSERTNQQMAQTLDAVGELGSTLKAMNAKLDNITTNQQRAT